MQSSGDFCSKMEYKFCAQLLLAWLKREKKEWNNFSFLCLLIPISRIRDFSPQNFFSLKKANIYKERENRILKKIPSLEVNLMKSDFLLNTMLKMDRKSKFPENFGFRHF